MNFLCKFIILLKKLNGEKEESVIKKKKSEVQLEFSKIVIPNTVKMYTFTFVTKLKKL